MSVNIEKMRADMIASQRQLEWETRKFVVQFIAAIAVAVGAGVAMANYFRSGAPAAPPPQIIYLQPINPAPHS